MIIRWVYRIFIVLLIISALVVIADMVEFTRELCKNACPKIWMADVLKVRDACKAAVGPLGIAVPLFGDLKWRFDDAPVKAILKTVIDVFQRKIFSKEIELRDHDSDFRVTLFRYRIWCWNPWVCIRWKRKPWAGWVRPYVRSGHTTQNSKVVFSAPKDGGVGKGVAGRIWTSGRSHFVEDMPVVSKVDRDNIRDYARKGLIPIDHLKKRLSRADESEKFPRSIYGHHIELKGKKWGVLVADSVSDKLPFRDKSAADSEFRPFTSYLTAILKGEKSG